jgi:predicted SprT family Zn-dependent metalloprotease
VRMLVPPIVRRREMDRNLVEFFRAEVAAPFRRAIADFCRFYNVRGPRIEWCEYIDWGRAAGKTFQDGRIHLVHPENWKRGRVYKSERMWVQTVYHELAHYLFWADAERKAETFTRRMVRGLKRIGRRRSQAPAAAAVARRKSTMRARAARNAAPVRRKPRTAASRTAIAVRRRRRSKVAVAGAAGGARLHRRRGARRADGAKTECRKSLVGRNFL